LRGGEPRCGTNEWEWGILVGGGTGGQVSNAAPQKRWKETSVAEEGEYTRPASKIIHINSDTGGRAHCAGRTGSTSSGGFQGELRKKIRTWCEILAGGGVHVRRKVGRIRTVHVKKLTSACPTGSSHARRQKGGGSPPRPPDPRTKKD